MITASQIAPLRAAGVDLDETERLKDQFAQLRVERCPLFLTAIEFDEILKWKLRGQYGRQRALREANTDEIIRSVTSLALTITHSSKDYELELRVNILWALRGVGVPVASAVLALVYPEQYAVIDFRGWRQIFDEQRTSFSVANYKRYMQEIRRLSQELGWTPQEVDLAIWEYDRRNNNLS
ncbi:MAG: hypothetical protein GY832_40895 [Chloroflexi bacterium]|nr:hypothetical protein [Chloroflexota bacterium]